MGTRSWTKAAREAVSIQIAYGRKHRHRGECRSPRSRSDLHKTYQYSAFGVPELGLKNGLADKLVVAPYATLLALSIAPQATVSNLKRLPGWGCWTITVLRSDGLQRRPGREGARGVIVRAYMAHHQGMSFLALTNFLHGNTLSRISLRPARAHVEPLLQERIPHLPPLHHIATRERISSVAGIGEVAPSVANSIPPYRHAQDPVAVQWPL